MHVFSLLFASISIAFVSANARNEVDHRNASAMDAEFSLTEVTKKWTEMSKYFSTKTQNEPIVPFLIERRWIKGAEVATRTKRATGNKTTSKKRVRMTRKGPKLVFVTDAGKGVQIIQYVYVAFSVIISVGLLIASVFGMLKTGTVVVVRNLYDENKPQRDFPATLTMFIRSKRQGKTPMETEPPKKPKTGLTKEKA